MPSIRQCCRTQEAWQLHAPLKLAEHSTVQCPGLRQPAGELTSARSPGLSDGITSPVIWVVIAAASRTIPEASATLNAAQAAVAPVSSIIAEVKSSPLEWMMSAALFKRVRRAPGPDSAHSGNAVAAASAANIASSTEAAAALVAHSPDIGLRRSKVFPPLAGIS